MSVTDPNLGLTYGWEQGENNWHTGMDSNLKKLGAIVGLSVLNRDLSTPPDTAANGQRYIVASNPTGSWQEKCQQIALRSSDGWDFYQAREGWLCYIVKEAKLVVYTKDGWSAGITMT